MLPSLTTRARLDRGRRALLVSGGLLLVLALVTARVGATGAPPDRPALAERLAPSTWAIAVPTAWFAAPLAGLRAGDRVDVLAIKPGERAVGSAIAFDLEVMSADDRLVVLGAGATDVTALAVARASGQLIVPLLRSAK
ncbi:MAG: hypothetical protein HY071_04935 [Chloroflexi bacterium]|nr:hypothetical protein [Chloroflexota bacterium]